MAVVAYFTVVVARSGSAWRVRDVELDEGAGAEGVADQLRAVAVDDEPVIAVLEHEDEWFALFRVDGDDDPRLFVSDLPAASRSGLPELLAAAAEVAADDDDGDDGDDDEESAEDPMAARGPAWAGDADILDDLGVTGGVLRSLVEAHDEDPAAVIADLGERVGFADLLEALR